MFNFIMDIQLTHDISSNLSTGKRLAEGAELAGMSEEDAEVFCQALAVLECMDREHTHYKDFISFTLKSRSRFELAAEYLKKAFHSENQAVLEQAIRWYDSVKAAN